jgi:L,D-peptidoglycan transpeptidase YkuD (ErfK/YbiS/YcfS/YnhG family)
MPSKSLHPGPRSAACLFLAAALSLFAATAMSAPGWEKASQMVLVTIPGWDADHGSMRTYVRDGAAWHEVGTPKPVTIGKAGAAWGVGLHEAQSGGPVKREGDNRSPAGVYRIGDVFGYAARADTAMPYRALHDTDYCIDTSASPLYTRIVDTRKVGEGAAKDSTEPMRRDLHASGDQRYRLGFVIEHNEAARKDVGSCIFGHLWKSPTSPTAGCTAMSDATMSHLLAWLKPKDEPVFVLLPESEYKRLRATWNLPAL